MYGPGNELSAGGGGGRGGFGGGGQITFCPLGLSSNSSQVQGFFLRIRSDI